MRPLEGALSKKMKSFARLASKASEIRENLYRKRTGHQTPASTMKTLFTICLCSLALALTLLAQSPAAPQTSPAAGAPAAPGAAAVTSPGAPAAMSPGAPAQMG